MKVEKHNPFIQAITTRNILFRNSLGLSEKEIEDFYKVETSFDENGVMPDASLGILYIPNGTPVLHMNTTTMDNGKKMACCRTKLFGFMCDVEAIKPYDHKKIFEDAWDSLFEM